MIKSRKKNSINSISVLRIIKNLSIVKDSKISTIFITTIERITQEKVTQKWPQSQTN